MSVRRRLPVGWFMDFFTPSHWNEEETWIVELRAQLLEDPSTLLELIRLFSSGVPQALPVIVKDGEVVDGHSRVLALWIAGIKEVWFEG